MSRATPPAPVDAPRVMDALIARAVEARASDLHLEPVAGGFEARLRIDGMLAVAEKFSREAGRMLVQRVMVMAGLLTYRQDVPQEGRLSALAPSLGKAIELRAAIMPTTHGLRAVLRLPAELVQPRTLEALALPTQALSLVESYTRADAGMLLFAGPAGSGKTTCVYALLSRIAAASPGLSIISIEDPVERDIEGVTQIEVAPFGELTYDRVIRSVLRQDPQVLAIGEVRDAPTAAIAAQAAITGHRLVTTIHAGTIGAAIVRLLDMGLEPFQVASALYGVIAIRLVRKLHTPALAATSSVSSSTPNAACGFAPASPYRGRVPIAEATALDDALREAILQRRGATELDTIIRARPGHVSIDASAQALVRDGVTDAAEVSRVLG